MTTSLDVTSIFRVLDAQAGKAEETILSPKTDTLNEALAPYPRDSRGRMTVDPEKVALREAAVPRLHTANWPDLLRDGIRFDAFTSYNETPVSYPTFARIVDSNRQQEEYLFDAALGRMPIVPEGAPYPNAGVTLGPGVIIKNSKYGMIIEVTEEMQKFDQVGKVRQLAELQGRSARLTEELAVMDVLTTTANYTRTTAAGDNDQGNNTQDLTFSAAGLIEALSVLTTMKDRRTGVKLGVNPTMLIVAPKLRWAAQQLVMSPQMGRQGGNTTNEIYGTGTTNPFFGVVNMVVASPYFGSGYQWALIEPGRAITFQRVEPFQILREAMDATSSDYFERDVIRYRVRSWFGVGMLDDRFAFFSNSTTAPVVS